MKLYIRDATPEDASYLDSLLTRLIRDESHYDPNIRTDAAVVDNYGQRIGLPGHKLLVCETEGHIVGYLYGFVYCIENIMRRPVAILDALFVDEAYRHQGCASMLISEFHKFAAENGACRMELKVLTENTGAIRLYQNQGFSETKKYMVMDF